MKTNFLRNKKIWVAGHNGMVGSAICKKLRENKINYLKVRRNSLNLTRQAEVEKWVYSNKPDIIFLAAAKVGGILANEKFPAEFITNNIQIQTNIITSAFKNNVKKLIFLGSACIYPISRNAIKESDLLTGKLESTNRAYSIAKIAGIEMCKFYKQQYDVNYISVQPNNLYGPNDNFSENSGHVIPSLIKKILSAKINKKPYCEILGTGKPKREFVYVDDLAEAILVVAEKYDKIDPINIGSGEEVTIKQLALLIRRIINYDGRIVFNSDFPDGVPKKFLDSSNIHRLGWKPKTKLMDGISFVYKWFLKNKCLKK